MCIYPFKFSTKMTSFGVSLLILTVAGTSKTEEFTFATQPNGATCPDKWTAFKESCYLGGHILANFGDAEEYCRQHDSHLVNIDDEAENNFLKELLANRRVHDWWIGLTDEIIEGVWTWYGNSVPAIYTDFHPTKPNNAGDCAAMLSKYQNQWVDEPCARSHYPLCEKRENIGQIVGK